MSWRTVVITQRCKLDYKLGFMVVRGDEDTKRIFIDEISLLLIEDRAVSLTAYLLSELVARKVRVIFCDGERNPSAKLVPYYGSHDSSAKLKAQISWSADVKGSVWTEIVSRKITKQRELLTKLGKTAEAALLLSYIRDLAFNDSTNREGHAAKVYFNALFGKDFARSDEVATNFALNYGYGIILAAVNREISACGYTTQLGIFHDNMFNHFNLGCDLMEPLRPLVDSFVIADPPCDFGKEEKHRLLSLLSRSVKVYDATYPLLGAVKVYVKSVMDALNDGDTSLIKFIDYEL